MSDRVDKPAQSAAGSGVPMSGDQYRMYRESMGMTQDMLAAALEISRRKIVRIEAADWVKRTDDFAMRQLVENYFRDLPAYVAANP